MHTTTRRIVGVGRAARRSSSLQTRRRRRRGGTISTASSSLASDVVRNILTPTPVSDPVSGPEEDEDSESNGNNNNPEINWENNEDDPHDALRPPARQGDATVMRNEAEFEKFVEEQIDANRYKEFVAIPRDLYFNKLSSILFFRDTTYGEKYEQQILELRRLLSSVTVTRICNVNGWKGLLKRPVRVVGKSAVKLLGKKISLLTAAVFFGEPSIVNILLHHGADDSITWNHGKYKNAFHLAAELIFTERKKMPDQKSIRQEKQEELATMILKKLVDTKDANEIYQYLNANIASEMGSLLTLKWLIETRGLTDTFPIIRHYMEEVGPDHTFVAHTQQELNRLIKLNYGTIKEKLRNNLKFDEQVKILGISSFGHFNYQWKIMRRDVRFPVSCPTDPYHIILAPNIHAIASFRYNEIDYDLYVHLMEDIQRLAYDLSYKQPEGFKKDKKRRPLRYSRAWIRCDSNLDGNTPVRIWFQRTKIVTKVTQTVLNNFRKLINEERKQFIHIYEFNNVPLIEEETSSFEYPYPLETTVPPQQAAVPAPPGPSSNAPNYLPNFPPEREKSDNLDADDVQVQRIKARMATLRQQPDFRNNNVDECFLLIKAYFKSRYGFTTYMSLNSLASERLQYSPTENNYVRPRRLINTFTINFVTPRNSLNKKILLYLSGQHFREDEHIPEVFKDIVKQNIVSFREDNPDSNDSFYLADVIGDGECFFHSMFVSLYRPILFGDADKELDIDIDYARSINIIHQFCSTVLEKYKNVQNNIQNVIYSENLLNFNIDDKGDFDSNDSYSLDESKNKSNLKTTLQKILAANYVTVEGPSSLINKLNKLTNKELAERYITFNLFMRLIPFILTDECISVIAGDSLLDFDIPESELYSHILVLLFPWIKINIFHGADNIVRPPYEFDTTARSWLTIAREVELQRNVNEEHVHAPAAIPVVEETPEQLANEELENYKKILRYRTVIKHDHEFFLFHSGHHYRAFVESTKDKQPKLRDILFTSASAREGT